MNKCGVCGSAIFNDEDYFDVVVWRMNGDDGVEENEVTMCSECKDRLLGN